MSTVKKVNITSKKSKDKESDASLTQSLLEIESSVQQLSTITNLTKLLKGYEDTKEKINNSSEKLKQIKQQFEQIKNDAKSDIKIDDKTFDEYMENIQKETSKDLVDVELEIILTKYKKILDKIKSCEKYLKDKKMELIYCDKDTKNDTSESSEADTDTEKSNDS